MLGKELPIAESFIVLDMLIQNINPLNGDIENNWIEETKKRLEFLDNNSLETISYEEFFLEKRADKY